MRLPNSLAGLALAAITTIVPLAHADDRSEINKCVDSVTNNTVVTVTVSGHKFICHGHIIVADEKEIRSLPNYNGANAFFKGALTHVAKYRPDDRITYFITVEDWAKSPNCRLAAPQLRIRTKYRSVWDKLPNWKDWKSVVGKYYGDWETVATLMALANSNRWAQSNEFAPCRREW